MSGTSTITATKTQTQFPSMWVVIFHNDDFTPMVFVIQVLVEIFNKSVDEAVFLTMKVHTTGSARIGVYIRSIAETKMQQTITAAENCQHPLLVTIEEV